MSNMQEDHQPVGGFTFYRFFCDAIRQLPKSKQLEMYNAICDYVFDGKEPDLNGDLLGVFWTLMKPALDNTKKTTRSKPARRGAPVGNRNAKRNKEKEQQSKDNAPCSDVVEERMQPTPKHTGGVLYADTLRRIKTSSAQSPPPLHREIAEIARDQAWIEAVCMLFHLKPEYLTPYFSAFRAECEASGQLQHNNTTDCKQHFKSWLRIQLNNRYKNEQSEQQKNKRRRTDVPPADKTDYHSSL